MKRATAADVARAAGVSRTTVSYVLNDTPHQQIPEATRHRVLEAAERLSYSPSAAARALVRGRSDVILFVFPAEVTLADWGRRVLSQMSRRVGPGGVSPPAPPRPRRPRRGRRAPGAPPAAAPLCFNRAPPAAPPHDMGRPAPP